MRFVEILREYNEQRLIHDFGNKLFDKWAKEKQQTNNQKIFNDKETWIPWIIENISSFDPTPNKELTFWLVNNYANNRISRFEDISSRAVPALLKFKALLRKPNLNPPLQIRDINQIKGLSQLEDIIEKYPDQEAESQSDQEDNFYKSGQAELLYNSDQMKIIIPKTESASCYFGKGTRWCTAAKNNNMFSEYYKKDDPLYIIYIKGTNEKYQFHFGSGQFMDSKDEEIDIIDLFKKFTELIDVFCPNTKGNFWERLITSNNISIMKELAKSDLIPEKYLNILSNDEHREVLQNIISNKNVTNDILNNITDRAIIDGSLDDILNSIITRIITSENIIRKIYDYYMKNPISYRSDLAIIAYKGNTSKDILSELTSICLKHYPIFNMILINLAENKNMSITDLEKLTNVSHWNISNYAKQTIEYIKNKNKY